MLVEAIDKLKNIPHTKIETYDFPVYRRMSQELERELFARFEEYKQAFAEQ